MPMAAEVVIAIYKPKRGKEKELLRILRRHVPLLRRERLATKRPVTLLRSRKSKSILEIFEWATATAADEAHENPRVMRLWGAMHEIAAFPPLSSLKEGPLTFPHFEPVNGVVR
jgi:hypothetical protein